MKHFTVCIFILFISVFIQAQKLESPDKNLILKFSINEKGEAYYELKYKNKYVVKNSKLGFLISSQTPFAKGFKITNTQLSSSDTSWNPVLGEQKTIRDNHNEMLVSLQQTKTGYQLNIRFRLFNDGLGFRYEFPVQKDLRHFRIDEELTEFNLARNDKSFWIPADYDTNEFQITTSRISEISSLIDKARDEPLAAKAPSKNLAVQTPLMLKSDNGLYINIHEAALVDYPAMHLNVDDKNYKLSTHLTPNKNGEKAYMQTQMKTPWRTIVVSDDARNILASKLILNLNDPNKIEDTSWIKPIKYVGVWWEYFTGGGSTWAYSDNQDIVIGQTDYTHLKPNQHHGANTQHVREYIDFAAENGFDAVLVEGWNEGWEDNWAYGKEKIYSFTKAYPDFNVEELQAYAKTKGVKIIMHHETTSSAVDYERQLDDAFSFMNKHGYTAVKTGYVGPIIPRSEYHDGQWMVNHYNFVAQKAAQYKIMVNSHEAVRPTGISRTYPNWIAQESARGTEFESFNGNRPDHTTILPFTRLMGGPMDYTPGIFQGNLSIYGKNKARLSTTLVKQLALYVTLYSPLQMAADLPENYKKHLDAFQFIKDVAIDWDNTYILEAEPGDYITIARKAKNKNEWFVGGITDENERTATINFNFLPKGKSFDTIIYEDGENADWKNSILDYKINKQKVNSATILKKRLAPSGGIAISIKEIK
ncbi:TPA: glycoside hydrolase family 97 protein [Elizabethkingia anophelis]|uniref:glycoside hydrolase family 97 protein n=1 Tax=Elizabethkingia TaxID=308865 RepID=UPI001629F9DE|nr:MULTISPECIES: glycoside hydrolase family 97 protein [Elizabethkingia]MCT3674909.1 glycoside hydrolase family 97 protein [Elizabethkingia anophelis]MCT3682393.1 glycoside hydrolase family 97 protein [Elizabethkingia anophelis]MCT3701633.1 glycoside hydrolase family 97 protein [Elizabethkingia anophelis]MCT3770680.1 glycoside hydrolase family 97 protein [Elizabethkingia anophelis]MCT3780968.1 glycoside hydrolase family 97 protein [Elizabethkingia anophelis]